MGVVRGTITTDSPLFFPLDSSALYSPSTKQSPYCMPLWGYFPDARPYTKHQQTVALLYASLGILPRCQAIHQTPTNSHLIVCLSGDTSPTPGHTQVLQQGAIVGLHTIPKVLQQGAIVGSHTIPKVLQQGAIVGSHTIPKVLQQGAIVGPHTIPKVVQQGAIVGSHTIPKVLQQGFYSTPFFKLSLPSSMGIQGPTSGLEQWPCLSCPASIKKLLYTPPLLN